jgi:hypothetical protein
MHWRSLRVRTLLGTSMLLASATVLLALPERQTGSRSATDAFIPFRNLTVQEAVVLLTRPAIRKDTAISELTDTTVVLKTRRYVFSLDGKLLTTHANWSSYASRYRLQRLELEHALGRRLTPDAAELTMFANSKVSFDSALIPVYIVAEIMFLTVWFAVFGFAVLRLRRLSLALPFTWLWLLAPQTFVFVYSPAFFDADWFFQRVVVERIALFGMVGGMWAALPAGVSFVIYLSAARRRGARRARRPACGRYRRTHPQVSRSRGAAAARPRRVLLDRALHDVLGRARSLPRRARCIG